MGISISSFYSENRGALAFALLVALAGLGAYAALHGAEDIGDMGRFAPVYREMRLKWEFGDHMDIYATASPRALARLKASEGEPVPSDGALVIGADEAAMMRRNGDLGEVGSSLEEGGVPARLGGVLGPTGTPLDMAHFFSPADFARAEGEEGRLFVRLTAKGEGKLFFREPAAQGGDAGGAGGSRPRTGAAAGPGADAAGEREGADTSVLARLPFAEGSPANYRIRPEDGRTVYPLVLGAEEARMMRAERLFLRAGDELKGFFGHDVFIAGVLAPTNSSADMMHFVPLGDGEW